MILLTDYITLQLIIIILTMTELSYCNSQSVTSQAMMYRWCQLEMCIVLEIPEKRKFK